MRQQAQADALCLGVNGMVPCVENRRFYIRGVTHATFNIQGSCNNLCDTAPDPAEWAARNQAVIAFRKPVAYVHGDSHYFRVDKPFLDIQGRRLENFTRVETFGNSAATGNNDVQWLKIVVTPRSREVFTYEPQIVPANRTAVPAP